MAMHIEIPPEVMDLPTSAEKTNLMWCASIAAMTDWTKDSRDILVLTRAINVAVLLAASLLKERTELGDARQP